MNQQRQAKRQQAPRAASPSHPHVVQKRLGHKDIKITLAIYAHVLPTMQQEAAERIGTLLHG